MLGEPDGTKSPRAQALSKAMTDAGLKAPVRPRLRDDIWIGVSGTREIVPRDDLPDRCPACQRPSLEEHRAVE